MKGLAAGLGGALLGALAGCAPQPVVTVAANPTTLRLASSKVTDDEAHFVWETDGATSWNSVSSSGFATLLANPTTQQAGKHIFEIFVKVSRFKDGGMDLEITRSNRRRTATGEGSGTRTERFIGLPTMPLSKIIQPRMTGEMPLPASGRIRLADFHVPASQYTNLEVTRFDGRWLKREASKRLRLVNGKLKDDDLRAPEIQRAMRKGFSVSGHVTPAKKAPLEIVIS